MNTTGPSSERRLNGWHVLAITVAFFGIVFAVNGPMVYYALGSFPGTVTQSSFNDSQRYNAEIAAAEAQQKRGWKVNEHVARNADGHAVFTVDARDAGGAPLPGVVFTGRLEHPMRRDLDVQVVMKPQVGADGRFAGLIEHVDAGQWDVVITGEKDGQRLYLSRNRIVLK